MKASEKKPGVKSATERLGEAAGLPMRVWEEVRSLAEQLQDKPILPLIGAGTSYDCGMDLAGTVSERMYQWYVENNGAAGAPTDLNTQKADLGLVADAVYAAGDQADVVDALGLPSKSAWPDASALPDHFCAYRVLARLARENLVTEAITLNYDGCFERGLEDEGFQFEPWELHGKTWLDHATVVADGGSHVRLDPRGQMVLTKAHGCATAYRRIADEVAESPATGAAAGRLEKAQEAIVIRRGQLLDWRKDFWARDLFADRARRHVILLLGVSGQDPVIQIALTRVLEEVYEHLEDSGSEPRDEPRVVAIDPYPHTVALAGLIHQGCGRKPPAESAITRLEVPKGQSMTAVITALAVEMLALCLLRDQNLALPFEPQARVTSLMVTVPASLRWTYLLERRRTGSGLAQRANLEHVGEKGYVPLQTDLACVAESLRVRGLVRQALPMESSETVEEALSGFGFVVSPSHGRAFMPLGIGIDQLRAVPAVELRAAAARLSAPTELDTVLVAAAGTRLVGRVVATGKEVSVP